MCSLDRQVCYSEIQVQLIFPSIVQILWLQKVAKTSVSNKFMFTLQNVLVIQNIVGT